MELLNSIGADVPINADPKVSRRLTPPVFSSSHENVFLWHPVAGIYAISNLVLVRTVNLGTSFEPFQTKLYPQFLTDDRKYLVTAPPIFKLNVAEIADEAYCYDLDANELRIKTIRFGTNQTLIVGAESIDGALQFLAFWERSDPARSSVFKHIGIFADTSDLIAELPIDLFPDEDRQGSDLWRDCLWDYRHSRIFVYREHHLLTMYDYKNRTTQRFQLEIGPLKTL